MEVKNVPVDLLMPQKAPSLKGSGDSADKSRAATKKVAQEFESLFVGMMLKSMRATTGKDTVTGGGRGEEMFRSMLDEEYASMAARKGSLGLAEMIEKQLNSRK